MKKVLLPTRLQFFAEGDGADTPPADQGTGSQAGTTPNFDYNKLADIIAGKQSVTEDTVLKSYFKQQGLSQEEMTQAIQSFKTEKAKNNPDVNAVQQQLTQAQVIAERAQIESMATMEAVALGIDVKTIPYVLKMADLSNAKGQDGKVNQESIKNALNKVLEDIPQLKPTHSTNQGFQIGGNGGGEQTKSDDAALKAAFGL